MPIFVHAQSEATATSVPQGQYNNSLYTVNPTFELIDRHIVVAENGDVLFKLVAALTAIYQQSTGSDFEENFQKLFEILGKFQKVTFELNSPGGSVRRLSAILDGIDTLIDSGVQLAGYIPAGGNCSSSCAAIFLYLKNRKCEIGSTMGLHAAHRGGVRDIEGTKLYVSQFSREHSSAPKDWIIREQLFRKVFETTKMTVYSCQELVSTGVAVN